MCGCLKSIIHVKFSVNFRAGKHEKSTESQRRRFSGRLTFVKGDVPDASFDARLLGMELLNVSIGNTRRLLRRLAIPS